MGIKVTFPQMATKKKVGVMASQGFTQPFKDKFTAAVITELKTQAELDAMLKAGTLDAVFTGNSEQKSGSKFDELCKKYPTIACDLAPKTTKATTKKGVTVVTTKKGASA